MNYMINRTNHVALMIMIIVCFIFAHTAFLLGGADLEANMDPEMQTFCPARLWDKSVLILSIFEYILLSETKPCHHFKSQQ